MNISTKSRLTQTWRKIIILITWHQIMRLYCTIKITSCEIFEWDLNWFSWFISEIKIRIKSNHINCCIFNAANTLIKVNKKCVRCEPFIINRLIKLYIFKIWNHVWIRFDINCKQFWIYTIRVRRVSRCWCCFVIIGLGETLVAC